MAKEAEQQIGSAAQPRESPVRMRADLRLGLGCGIAHPRLDVPMTPLLRVQVRGIRREPLDIDLGVLGQERLDHGGPMGLQAVPDDDLRPADLATEMLQVCDGVLAVDRVIEVLSRTLLGCLDYVTLT